MGMDTTHPDRLRAIVYTRVSTGRQADSGLGLTDQLAQANAAVAGRGWTVVHYAQDAGLSGKTVDHRPGLVEALTMLDRGDADVLVVAKLDRLSRSVVDFAKLMERATKRGWSVVCLDLGVDTSTPSGQLMANVMAAFAQHERALIAERTRASHAVRRQRGQRAGQLPELPEDVRQRIGAEVTAGRPLLGMADDLNREGVPTARGGRWHASTIAHVMRSLAKERELAIAAAEVA